MNTVVKKETLNVSILGRSYTLLCSPDEKASLLASVALVDQKMQTINQQMGLSGHDKIAVFAALQIAHELLQHNLHNHASIEAAQRINAMNNAIDEVMSVPQTPLF
ncbi:Cell division protein ZapA [Ephemeroptericola cinctiostellae]|uniref:Cell division protein ZapA n=1 Tax=Ephemeroptericola cinctiostellae TaxID=2268024 RepID=A0A345DE26_9BURK|nr:cell division protein ZapA [Ephemeroptericola cinctiostellae]AXF86614.1 Cell division protein ZapA [Ephemeroptericola cinctiostellae]